MRILHYFLGFHRQGGLNRYAADLSRAQSALGDEVFVLYPAGNLFPQKKVRIKEVRARRKIRCFSLTGGPVVPLLEGIKDPAMILDCPRRLSTETMKQFWQTVAPDVLHIHTFMGMPEELFAFAKNSGVKIIYTTHDYFGLCPKVNRLRGDGTVCTAYGDDICSYCNQNAPSERRLALRNLEWLFCIRKLILPLLRLLPKRSVSPAKNEIPVMPFSKLRQRYADFLRQCDVVHFNSPVTEKIFTEAIPGLHGVMLPITHGGIQDRRNGESRTNEPIRLLFLGSSLPYKGLPMLLSVLQQLEAHNIQNWKLDVHGTTGKNQKRVLYYGVYQLKESWKILAEHDLVIVPSICDETFGFVVEEALCCGIPVLCSDRAGAKILLPDDWVFSGEDDLTAKLTELLQKPEMLSQRKEFLRQNRCFILMDEHVARMKEIYREA